MSNPSATETVLPAVRTTILFSFLIAAGFLCVFVRPVFVIAVIAAAALTALLIYFPVTALGIVLALMPMHFLLILLAEFYGFSHMTVVSALTKEVCLLVLAFVLWQRNGFKPTAPDWFLLAFLVFALVRACFGGTFMGLVDDVGFVIPYSVGRFCVLTKEREYLWARSAVWIAAALSVIGMFEVFALGDTPRKLLYAVVSGEDLPDSFVANGLEGFRAASTMIGPLSFAALCMVALILWWVYLRNPMPAVIVFAGLISTLTRSAWLGVALAVTFLAVRLGQKKRLAYYLSAALILFILSIPVLGIRDYISITSSGQDTSEDAHRETVLAGMAYVAENPLGTGPGSIGPRAVQQFSTGFNIEDSFLTLAAQYGVLPLLCFLGFLATAIARTWKSHSQLGNAATAILIGFSVMMIFLPIHQDIRLACWVWFPVGLCIRERSLSETNRYLHQPIGL